MGMGKRYSWLEPVPTKVHWRQNFEIQGDKVSVINTTSELDVEKDGVTKRKVPAKDFVTKMRNNTIILGATKDHLNLVFLKPKQTTWCPGSRCTTLTATIVPRWRTTSFNRSSRRARWRSRTPRLSSSPRLNATWG